MSQLFFRVIFDFQTRPYGELWEVIDKALHDYYPDESKGWFFGVKKIKREAIHEIYKNSFGRAYTHKFSISISRSGSNYFDYIMMTMHEHNIEFIDSIMRTFCTWPEFIYGYATDLEFNTWQNAATPYSYIMSNKPHEHIPRLPGQELGKDLWNERLDLSTNPGHTLFHMGYVESIGGVMYVTDKQLALSGGSKDNILNLPFLKIDDWGKCLRLELDSSFLADAEQNPDMCERMDAVRSALFPRKETRDQARS
jgi:hypothetical protein